MRHVGRRIGLITFLFVSLALVGCGKSQYSEDGLPSPSGRFSYETHDFPAVVLVVLPHGDGICTGTFISERAVLTAAHCALTSGTYDVITDFGTFSTSTVKRLGPGVVDDPNDIAILVFSQKVADRSKGQVLDIDSSVRSGDTAQLVGYGCDNLDTKGGAGVKRTGTNVVSDVNDYVNFLTPNDNRQYGILGPDNRAGSCFGDSGGPALKNHNGTYKVAAVTHAGGTYNNSIVSEYVDISNRNDNRSFIASVNSQYNLDIRGL